jgi:2-dehydropantoate 2-reductase
MKIAILGIGGVGGYIGAFLAREYEHSDSVEIYFIARGENEKIIRQQGISVESSLGSFTAFPKKIFSESVPEIVDLLICCTKNYDLEQSIQENKSCIGPDTIILPLLNGVNSAELIKSLLPANEVWEGCIYIVSKLVKPGLIHETGKSVKLYFGPRERDQTKSKKFAGLFQKANIQALVPADILVMVWEKFLCISVFATITSYLDSHIGPILADKEQYELVLDLLHEGIALARAKKLALSEDIFEKTLAIITGFPSDATSSMHLDFQKGKKTELEYLTGYVVRSGESLNIPLPLYQKMYLALKERNVPD